MAITDFKEEKVIRDTSQRLMNAIQSTIDFYEIKNKQNKPFKNDKKSLLGNPKPFIFLSYEKSHNKIEYILLGVRLSKQYGEIIKIFSEEDRDVIPTEVVDHIIGPSGRPLKEIIDDIKSDNYTYVSELNEIIPEKLEKIGNVMNALLNDGYHTKFSKPNFLEVLKLFWERPGISHEKVAEFVTRCSSNISRNPLANGPM